ncbi:MAG: replicative DNA helicase [Elusimicrobia bacterium CG1_02_37_114]|nr:MAG: replicative DNA helicase [Elusimicrobia bacterium CG1_02_37_114]PIV52697.1 MAG: replicative DNA helicase [Elusimicrobia bacterium CG02_land_8_20_14_3_00_37_13]PIZ13030.1 MAG: replicative DNA helicase [Elusimicrobia bacterium CG_4_10_14_0_8_um_filter_37_32]
MREIVRVPPHSSEAEIAVLGSMLIEISAIEKALEILEDKHFYDNKNRKLFQVISKLYADNIPVDLVSVTEQLKKEKILEDIGGAGYLTELINIVSTSANIEHYAKIVREKAVLRELIQVSTRIAEEGYNGPENIDAYLDHAEESVFSVARVKSQSGFIKVKDLVHPAIDHLHSLIVNKENPTGVPTGYKSIDAKIGRLQPGDLIIVAGRPSMGKTSFCMNLLSNAAIKHKCPVGIFSMEMSRESIMVRLLCSEARISSHDFRQGTMSNKLWSKVTTIVERIYEAPIWIDDTRNLSVLDIRARARRLASEMKASGMKLSVIAIDYIQQIRGSYRAESRQQEVSEISRSLKALAGELGIPIIAVSQLSRKTEERGREGRPVLSDLRESGALEQDADIVMFIWQESKYKHDREDLKNKATIIVAKHRNGPTGDVELAFIEEYTRFEELAKE